MNFEYLSIGTYPGPVSGNNLDTSCVINSPSSVVNCPSHTLIISAFNHAYLLQSCVFLLRVFYNRLI